VGLLAAALFAAIVIVFVVLWAAVAMNGQTVGRPEDKK
jgi:hypothetical protein